jgi:hypothetical protein
MDSNASLPRDHLERLNSYSVTFHSYTEPHLCADNDTVRGILLAVLATWPISEPSEPTRDSL